MKIKTNSNSNSYIHAITRVREASFKALSKPYKVTRKVTRLSALPVACLSMALIAPAAQADEFDREGVRGETYCFPAKFAVKTLSELQELDADKKDIVDVTLDPQFLIYDGGKLPDRYFLKSANGETDFTVQADGQVPDFIPKVRKANADDEVCITDVARAGLDADDESLYFEMGLTPFFKNHSGEHSLAELKEGTEDGKDQYKKMIPSIARMFMPSTDHLHVKYDDKGQKPKIFAQVKEALVPIKAEYYNEGYVFDLGTLEKMNAQALVVQGGAYKLAPVTSIKTMKKYGIGKPRGPKAKTAG